MKIIDKTKFTTGMFDSDTNQTLQVQKAVDITEHCFGNKAWKRTVLLYTKAKRGPMVIIVSCISESDDANSGTRIAFFVDELEREFRVRPDDDTFGQHAD